MRLEEPNNLPISTGFTCPITLALMEDPVLCTLDQYTYEREAIVKELTNTGRSPMNRAKLNPKQSVETVLVPNQNLRDSIKFFVMRMRQAEAIGGSLV